jgi:L-rhamnose mutarotase
MRIVRALDLVDDAGLISAYEAAHAAGQVPPAVIRDIREQGYLTMEIWRVADRLVMIAEVADDYPRAGDPALAPAVGAWEARMDLHQRPILQGGPKWAEMRRIFSLDEQ